jgi:hypothetical protein
MKSMKKRRDKMEKQTKKTWKLIFFAVFCESRPHLDRLIEDALLGEAVGDIAEEEMGALKSGSCMKVAGLPIGFYGGEVVAADPEEGTYIEVLLPQQTFCQMLGSFDVSAQEETRGWVRSRLLEMVADEPLDRLRWIEEASEMVAEVLWS